MNLLKKTSKLERAVATSMLATTSERIFDQGKDANNTGIGKYSKEYLKQRRKKGYSSSRKVILQATRQMVNDWSVVPVDSNLGLGFKNETNANKAEWVEDTYDKSIFSHTKKEIKELNSLFQKGLKKIING